MGLVFRGYSCYIQIMTTKEIVIKTIREMPDSVSWTDIEERIRFLAAIDRGLKDIDTGHIVSHERVKATILTGFREIREKQIKFSSTEIKKMIYDGRK